MSIGKFSAPGHGTPSEYLHFIAASNKVENAVVPLTAGNITVIPPIENRKTIIIQFFTDCWVKFGAEDAAVGQGLFMGTGAIFGLDILSGVPVSLIPDSASGNVNVVQVGG